MLPGCGKAGLEQVMSAASMPISPYNADMQTSSQESTTELRFRPFSNNRWVRRAVETFDKECASMYKTVDAVVYLRFSQSLSSMTYMVLVA